MTVDMQLSVVFFCTMQVTEGLLSPEQRSPALSRTRRGMVIILQRQAEERLHQWEGRANTMIDHDLKEQKNQE